MKPNFRDHVDVFQIPFGTDDWYRFRTIGIEGYDGGVGASESGKLLGMDKYRPCMPEVFAHKVGYDFPKDINNIAIEKGKLLEPLIRDVWSFWHGNNQEENIQALKDYNSYQAGQPVQRRRTYKTYGYYLVNPKYKWLFCSLDALINTGEPTVHGEVLEHDAPLEIKTISYWAAQQWAQRMPPKYAVQVDQQMLITGSEYAELCMWEDGIIRVYTFGKNVNSQNMLLQVTYQFWERVMKARELYKLIPRYQGDTKAINDILGEIQRLEPDADSSEAYTEYMKERSNSMDTAKGTPRAYRAALNYKKMAALENLAAQQKNLWRNSLLRELSLADASVMDFNKFGKVSNGKNLTVNVKPAIDPSVIESEFKKIVKTL
jgi:predicted phage-related endonuclease